MGMISELEHEDYGPQRRAAEKAIGQTRDFVVDQATDPLNWLGPLGRGASVGAKVARGMFAANMAGKAEDAQAMFFGGKYLPKDVIDIAEKLLKKGMSPEDLFKQTGYFKNPQGEWRMYVSDKGSAVDTLKWLKGTQSKLGEWLVNPTLYKMDPNLATKIKIKNGVLPEGVGGEYLPSPYRQVTISNNIDPKDLLNIVGHETQHGVQEVGGVSGGANTGEFSHNAASASLQSAAQRIHDLKQTYRQKYGVPFMDDLGRWVNNGDKIFKTPEQRELFYSLKDMNQRRVDLTMRHSAEAPYWKYMNNPGETEARITGSLMNRDLRAEKNGFQDLFDLYGKEITNRLYYIDPLDPSIR